jgi:hypothetical protein
MIIKFKGATYKVVPDDFNLGDPLPCDVCALRDSGGCAEILPSCIAEDCHFELATPKPETIHLKGFEMSNTEEPSTDSSNITSAPEAELAASTATGARAITVRLPLSQIRALEKHARGLGIGKRALMRRALSNFVDSISQEPEHDTHS